MKTGGSPLCHPRPGLSWPPPADSQVSLSQTLDRHTSTTTTSHHPTSPDISLLISHSNTRQEAREGVDLFHIILPIISAHSCIFIGHFHLIIWMLWKYFPWSADQILSWTWWLSGPREIIIVEMASSHPLPVQPGIIWFTDFRSWENVNIWENCGKNWLVNEFSSNWMTIIQLRYWLVIELI